jgi:hypothetical protein
VKEARKRAKAIMAKEGKVEGKRDVEGQRSEVRAVVGCPVEES